MHRAHPHRSGGPEDDLAPAVKKIVAVLVILFVGYWLYQHRSDFSSKVNAALEPEPPRDPTATLQAADLAGYNGSALRQKVNSLKKENDKHNDAINQRVELNTH